MAVGVKILLACLLATHVASQVLAYSVLAKQYPQEVKHGFLQNSEECPDILLENGNVTYSESNTNTTPGHWPVRTVASLRCNVGYALLYDKDRVCLKSGMWSGYSSSCVVSSCQEKFNVSGGCCTAGNCLVGSNRFGSCSCSANCYNNPWLTCCPDIGCPRGYQYSNCTEAGFFTSSSKFCLWKGKENGDANCYLPKGHCFCDEECCSLDDCCPDVDCSSKATSQVPTEDPTLKELASELSSMSRVQELSNELQRAGWEAILRELQEIQKEE